MPSNYPSPGPSPSTRSGIDISESEFDVFVDRCIDAMVEAGVPHPAHNRLLALLAPMREDIIRQ